MMLLSTKHCCQARVFNYVSFISSWQTSITILIRLLNNAVKVNLFPWGRGGIESLKYLLSLCEYMNTCVLTEILKNWGKGMD